MFLAVHLVGRVFAATLTDLAPETTRDPVVVVVSPGFAPAAFSPLAQALRDDGRDVHLLRFACEGQNFAAVVEEYRAALANFPVAVTVVAHGLGATVALAAPEVRVRNYALLAPMLDAPRSALAVELAGRASGPVVALDAPRAPWNGLDPAAVLLGEELPPLSCLPGPLAADLAGWVRSAGPTLPLERVTAPTWIGVGLTDEVATPEATIPASRRLPNRHLERLGLNRLDPEDYDHGELLVDRVPILAVVRGAR